MNTLQRVNRRTQISQKNLVSKRSFYARDIAGDEALETSVRQNGSIFAMNFGELYWNSRLEGELYWDFIG